MFCFFKIRWVWTIKCIISPIIWDFWRRCDLGFVILTIQNSYFAHWKMSQDKCSIPSAGSVWGISTAENSSDSICNHMFTLGNDPYSISWQGFSCFGDSLNTNCVKWALWFLFLSSEEFWVMITERCCAYNRFLLYIYYTHDVGDDSSGVHSKSYRYYNVLRCSQCVNQ